MEIELILHKQFLTDFFDEFDEENDYYVDFQKFIKKRCKGFVLIIDALDAEYSELLEESPLLTWLDGNSKEVIRKKNISASINCQNGSVFKLFLTNLTNVNCQDLKEKYGYIYLNAQNIVREWEVFYSEREDKSQSISNGEFDNWHKLNAFSHSLNTILIFDNYILNEKPKQPRPVEVRLEDNLFPVLKELLPNTALDVEVDIMIFAEKFYHYASHSTDITVVYAVIEAYLRLNFSHLSFNLSIIQYDKFLHEGIAMAMREHDRFIITNYFLIDVIAGLDAFNATGAINRRTKINFHAIFEVPHTKNVKIALENIEKYVFAITNTHFTPHKFNRFFM